jgi:hypothetical protein
VEFRKEMSHGAMVGACGSVGEASFSAQAAVQGGLALGQRAQDAIDEVATGGDTKWEMGHGGDVRAVGGQWRKPAGWAMVGMGGPSVVSGGSQL